MTEVRNRCEREKTIRALEGALKLITDLHGGDDTHTTEVHKLNRALEYLQSNEQVARLCLSYLIGPNETRILIRERISTLSDFLIADFERTKNAIERNSSPVPEILFYLHPKAPTQTHS